MNVYFDDDSWIGLTRIKGHVYLEIQIIRKDQIEENETIEFVLDTGAYITVISRKTAILYEYDKLPGVEVPLIGFNGKEKADLVTIPALRIVSKLITNIPVLIPHSTRSTEEILGMNVLEYFKYYVDTEGDRIYMKLNPNPKLYANEEGRTLACGSIVTVKSTDSNSLKLEAF